MESKKEHFVIKIKTKEGELVYWTESLKQTANITANPSSAKKYSNFDEAMKKAQQISEKNGVITWVVKVETIVKTDEVECFVPTKKLNNKKDAFWKYMEPVDEKSDFFREMMIMGTEYFGEGKNPNEYLDEIIDKVKKKMKMK